MLIIFCKIFYCIYLQFIVSSFLKMASPELACVYAALILNDDNLEITSDKISSILTAVGVKIESYWIDLFTEYFKTHDLTELIKGISLGGTSTISNQSDENSNVTNEENKDDKKEEEEIEIEGGFDDLFN